MVGEREGLKIVIVKNCATPIHVEQLQELAQTFGKRLELIQTAPCSKTRYRGKGYGEGATIADALEKSLVLSNRAHFFKCTGKLFARKIPPQAPPGCRAQFSLVRRPTVPGTFMPRWMFRSASSIALLATLRRLRIPWCLLAYSADQQIDTRFYWTTTDFYRTQLKDAYREVCEPLGYNLEDVFFQQTMKCPGSAFCYAAPRSSDVRELSAHLLASCPIHCANRAEEIARGIIA